MPTGRAGLRRHRSHDVVAIDHCRIAAPGIDLLRVTEGRWPGVEAVDAVAPSVGEPLAVVLPLPEGAVVPVVHERVAATWSGPDGGRQTVQGELAVSARGFWQVHPGAARTFVEAVMDAARPRPGERALDLYAGVGLFAAALAVGRRPQRARSSPSSPTPVPPSTPAPTSPTSPAWRC